MSAVEYAPGAEPLVPGKRYRFTAFVGESWEATVRSVERDGTHWLLRFDDRSSFATNLPLTWEPAGSPEGTRK